MCVCSLSDCRGSQGNNHSILSYHHSYYSVTNSTEFVKEIVALNGLEDNGIVDKDDQEKIMMEIGRLRGEMDGNKNEQNTHQKSTEVNPFTPPVTHTHDIGERRGHKAH